MSSKELEVSFEDFVSQPLDDLVCAFRPTREDNRRIRLAVEKVVGALQPLSPGEIVRGGAYGKGTHLTGQDEADVVALFSDVSALHEDRYGTCCWWYGTGGGKYEVTRGEDGSFWFKEGALCAELRPAGDWRVADFGARGCLRLQLDGAGRVMRSHFKTAGGAEWGAPIVAVPAAQKRLADVVGALEGLGSSQEVRDESVRLTVDGVAVEVFVGPYLEDEEDRVREVGAATVGDVPPGAGQVEFIRHQDARYKDLVRCCRVWRRVWGDWPPGSRPPSVLLELLALEAYGQAPRPERRVALEDAFCRFLELLQQRPLRVAWGRHYDAAAALGQPCFAGAARIVLDPADPAHNVAGAVRDWGPAEDRAAQTLGALKAVAGPAAGVFRRLRADLAAARGEVGRFGAELEAVRAEARGLRAALDAGYPRVEFDLTRQTFSRGHAALQSPTFSAAGLHGLKLQVYPRGTTAESGHCALFLFAPEGSRLKCRLIIDETESEAFDHMYESSTHWGYSDLCPIQDLYSVAAVRILQGAFVKPGSNMTAEFEAAVGSAGGVRVTWDVSQLGVPDKGQKLTSQSFSADGVPGLCLDFYPKGSPKAEPGKCSLVLQARNPCRLKWRLFVDDHEDGPADVGFVGEFGAGCVNFCDTKSFYTKVGVVVSGASLSASPYPTIRIYG